MDAVNTVAKFMNAWKNSDWAGMLENSQITWRSKRDNNSELLKNWFYLKDLLTFKILKINQISDSFVDVLLSIRYAFGDSKLKETKIRARIICEIEPYKPSKNGGWGVRAMPS